MLPSAVEPRSLAPFAPAVAQALPLAARFHVACPSVHARSTW
jgi:hypothetical protein